MLYLVYGGANPEFLVKLKIISAKCVLRSIGTIFFGTHMCLNDFPKIWHLSPIPAIYIAQQAKAHLHLSLTCF